MEKRDSDLEAAAAGILALAKHNIPVDISELLVRGDSIRGIPLGALSGAISYDRSLKILKRDRKDDSSENVRLLKSEVPLSGRRT